MNKDIQPEYNQTTITCACGNVLEVGSTKKDLKVDVCSKCHPFWTGNLRQDTVMVLNNSKIRVDVYSFFIFYVTFQVFSTCKIYKNILEYVRQE